MGAWTVTDYSNEKWKQLFQPSAGRVESEKKKRKIKTKTRTKRSHGKRSRALRSLIRVQRTVNHQPVCNIHTHTHSDEKEEGKDFRVVVASTYVCLKVRCVHRSIAIPLDGTCRPSVLFRLNIQKPVAFFFSSAVSYYLFPIHIIGNSASSLNRNRSLFFLYSWCKRPGSTRAAYSANGKERIYFPRSTYLHDYSFKSIIHHMIIDFTT